MGKIVLNGQVLKGELEAETILELVAAVEDRFVEEGNIVTEVKLDGEQLSEFTSADGSLLPHSGNETIEINTSQLNLILSNSLQEFSQYLNRLIPGLSDVATLYREGKTEEAHSFYAQAIDGVRVMIELIQGMSSSDIFDFSEKRYNGASMIEMTEELKNTVMKLVEAQTAGKDHELADLMEGELARELSRWQSILPELREQIEQRG